MRIMDKSRLGNESGGLRLTHKGEITNASITERMASADPQRGLTLEMSRVADSGRPEKTLKT